MLPEAMDIVYAREFLESVWKTVGDSGAEITLQGGGVRRITSPCVQVMLSAAKTLAGRGGKLIVQQPSAALCDAMRDLGLEANLKEWSGA